MKEKSNVIFHFAFYVDLWYNIGVSNNLHKDLPEGRQKGKIMATTARVNVTDFKKSSISPKCYVCKGECWHEGDPAATQRAVIEKFGVMPNDCINDSYGNVRCPAVNGLL